jgi:hypothetical protein
VTNWHAMRMPGLQRHLQHERSVMNNAHPIRLVLADVDGTLVMPDKSISERSRAAVRKLGEANIAFAVTSGRPPRGMAMLLEPRHTRTASEGRCSSRPP